ncbi:MAG: hypothetical protein HC769_33320 [Cyanobacteria bacterium CRU_2_1]|nr:hypothetical protein [Cyanobacteria bacterium CRU_2_1]
MSKTLSIEIPDEIYQTLLQTAERLGQSPEAIVSQWIVTQHHTQSLDPLDSFIGAFKSEFPDWTSRHDEYLGVTLLETHDQP